MLGRKSHPKTEEQQPEKRGFDDYDLRLGDIMRGERATMGKSLLDVQRELKIKATYIAAVENSDPSVFETPGFIAGYVRSYARFLGLDPEWAFQRFCEESGFTGVEGLSAGTSNKPKTASAAIRVKGDEAIIKPVAPYVPSGESILSRIEPGAVGSVTVMLALIGGLGYGAWSVLQEIQRVDFAPVEQAPGVVAELETQPSLDLGVAGVVEASSGFAAPSADALDRLYRPQALDAPVLTARDGPIASLDPSINGALIDEAAETFVAGAGGLAEPVLTPVTPQVVAEVSPNVVMFAVRPAWVRVASADGTVLFEKTLDKGESYVLPQSDEAPLLRAGNAGAVYFNVMGATFGPVGPGASVAKNVELSMNAIVETYDIADLDADTALADVVQAMNSSPALVAPDAPVVE